MRHGLVWIKDFAPEQLGCLRTYIEVFSEMFRLGAGGVPAGAQRHWKHCLKLVWECTQCTQCKAVWQRLVKIGRLKTLSSPVRQTCAWRQETSVSKEERERVEKVVHLGEMVRRPDRRVVLLYTCVLHIHLFLLRKAWCSPQDVLDHVRRVRDVEGRGGQGLRLSDDGVSAWANTCRLISSRVVGGEWGGICRVVWWPNLHDVGQVTRSCIHATKVKIW